MSANWTFVKTATRSRKNTNTIGGEEMRNKCSTSSFFMYLEYLRINTTQQHNKTETSPLEGLHTQTQEKRSSVYGICSEECMGLYISKLNNRQMHGTTQES